MIFDTERQKSFLIELVENDKEFEKLEEGERNEKNVERLIMIKSVIENINIHFGNFKTKRAITILRCNSRITTATNIVFYASVALRNIYPQQ